jgi:CTP-dependent riboflavin kinase
MTVGGVDGHLVWAEDAPGTVELLAPVRLRDLLDVVDGDQVTVEVRSSPF